MAQKTQRERFRQWLHDGDPELVPLVHFDRRDIAGMYFDKPITEVTFEDDLAAKAGAWAYRSGTTWPARNYLTPPGTAMT